MYIFGTHFPRCSSYLEYLPHNIVSNLNVSQTREVDFDGNWRIFARVHLAWICQRIETSHADWPHRRSARVIDSIFRLRNDILSTTSFYSSLTSLDRWTYPPFSGTIDEEWVYGRGSGDCKNNVIGIMTAVEHLIDVGWKPRRTIGMLDVNVNLYENHCTLFLQC
jgi:hypothetical protein